MGQDTHKLSMRRLARYTALMERLDAYLESNWAAPLYDDACARELGMSPKSLSTMVTAMRGMSVQGYVRDKRLAAIRDALSKNENGDCIGRIVKAYGFQHLAEFASEYRRRSGERPSETALREAAARAPFADDEQLLGGEEGDGS
jgi:AraC-like DNA-binding protein